MSQARIHPPSEQRLADARRAGHVPRAPLVGLFAAFVTLMFWLSFAGPSLFATLGALYRLPLERAERGEPLPSLNELTPFLHSVALELGIGFALTFCALALGTFLVQGPAFGFGSAVRLKLPKLRQGRTGKLLFVFGLPVVLFTQLPRVLRVEVASVASLLGDLALMTGMWLALCGLVEASLARARHIRSLWLTRAEYQDEQREAYGSPEMRRARDRARREAGMGP